MEWEDAGEGVGDGGGRSASDVAEAARLRRVRFDDDCALCHCKVSA